MQAGVSTDAIDRAVHDRIISAGAYPSPLNYHNFPKSVCTSVNECICHGIPDSRLLLVGLGLGGWAAGRAGGGGGPTLWQEKLLTEEEGWGPRRTVTSSILTSPCI